MLGFVTTVRHPLNSTSYDRVERLLEATLRSVCRQSDPDFCVVVVHNQLPKVELADNRVHFVQVGFPAPSEERTSRIDFSAHLRDKGTKYAVGIGLWTIVMFSVAISLASWSFWFLFIVRTTWLMLWLIKFWSIFGLWLMAVLNLLLITQGLLLFNSIPFF